MVSKLVPIRDHPVFFPDPILLQVWLCELQYFTIKESVMFMNCISIIKEMVM
jgi:hypothetical protein